MQEDKFQLWEDVKNCEAYKLAIELGEIIWSIVDSWDWFTRKTIGYQYVSAADSVGANISEGWGRYSFQDKYNFYRIARGSLLETMTWTVKSQKRGLLKIEEQKKLKLVFDKLPFELNKLMSRNREIKKKWRE